MLGVLALGGRPICFVGTCQQLRRHLCLTWLAPLFPLVLNVVHHSGYYIPPPFCVICLPFLYFSKFTMPRASARLQRKRSQGEATTGATSKRPRRNQQPSQPTIFPSVQSAVTSVDPSTSSPSFNNDLISRLADAVTQRLRQENQPSLTALQSADTPVMEIPATIPSTPQCLPSHSLPVLESAVQASHLATQSAVSLGEPSDPFISSSLSLDVRVSEKIRAKIWNQEYVDFGSLLINPIRQSRFQLTVSNAESGQRTSLCMEPAEKPRRITSIESWLSAFHVFVGVYTMKYPTESPALMKYGLLIRDLAARGHNWCFYDENFPFINQSHVSSLPWGTIHSELWLHSHSGTSTSKSPRSGVSPGPRTKADRPIPYGFCFKFHRGLVCAGCHFKHTCFKCNGDHIATTLIFVPQEIIIQSTNSLCLPKVKLPTPVQADRLILLLDGYDHSTVEFLRCGFTEGFSIHFDGDLTEIVSKNLLSAIQQSAVVEAKLSKEIDAGRIAGPFQTPPFPKFRVYLTELFARESLVNFV